jgi:pre-mRNA-splicing factor SYF2
LDDLEYGEAPEVPEARMRAMVNELEAKAERKTKFRRRKAEYEEQDMLYINAKNKDYLKKLDRSFGKYTKEIESNLERGTAL